MMLLKLKLPYITVKQEYLEADVRRSEGGTAVLYLEGLLYYIWRDCCIIFGGTAVLYLEADVRRSEGGTAVLYLEGLLYYIWRQMSAGQREGLLYYI